MNSAWDVAKEVFYTLGSIAGVIALSRPVLESKHNRDIERIKSITSDISEELLSDLAYRLWYSRLIPKDHLEPLTRIQNEADTGHSRLVFTGITAPLINSEIETLLLNYQRLRTYIQVPYWLPFTDKDNEEKDYWSFNKELFLKEYGSTFDYSQPLREAATCVDEIRKSQRRLIIISEMHFLETPFAKYILPRRSIKQDIKAI